MTTKIAAITEDGVTISQHFGRAIYYAVLTVEEGRVVKQELREKLGHRQFAGQEAHQEGERHGYGAGASDRHARMVAAIADCEVLLCRGTGWGAGPWRMPPAPPSAPSAAPKEELAALKAQTQALQAQLDQVMKRIEALGKRKG